TSQTHQTLENIRAILAEAGTGFDDVVQSRAYLTRIQEDFTTFDSIYREYFSTPFPARTTIGIELAIPGLLVEIDVVATVAS
ncbi:RidA family protein, partial [Pseudactinotalea sp. Z1732]